MNWTKTPLLLLPMTAMACHDPCYLGLEGTWDLTVLGDMEGLGVMEVVCQGDDTDNVDYPYLISGSFEAAPFAGEFEDLTMAAWGWISQNVDLPNDQATIVDEQSGAHVTDFDLKGNPYGGDAYWAIRSSAGRYDGTLLFDAVIP